MNLNFMVQDELEKLSFVDTALYARELCFALGVKYRKEVISLEKEEVLYTLKQWSKGEIASETDKKHVDLVRKLLQEKFQLAKQGLDNERDRASILDIDSPEGQITNPYGILLDSTDYYDVVQLDWEEFFGSEDEDWEPTGIVPTIERNYTRPAYIVCPMCGIETYGWWAFDEEIGDTVLFDCGHCNLGLPDGDRSLSRGILRRYTINETA